LSIAVDVAIKSFSNCGRPRRFEPRDSSVHCRLTQYHPAHKFLGVYVAWHGSWWGRCHWGSSQVGSVRALASEEDSRLCLGVSNRLGRQCSASAD